MNLEGEDSKKETVLQTPPNVKITDALFSLFVVTLYLTYLSAAQKPILPKTTTKKQEKKTKTNKHTTSVLLDFRWNGDEFSFQPALSSTSPLNAHWIRT